MNTKVLNIVLIASVILLVLFNLKTCRNFKDEKLRNEAINDTLTSYIDKNGTQVSKIKVLTAESKKTLLQLNSNDSTIVWLQKLVKDYKGKINSAIVFSNSTSNIGVSESKVVYVDSFYRDSILVIYPEYSTEWNDRWSEGLIRANRDSIFRSFKVKNEYEITLGALRNGWFKRKEYEVVVRNLNPNTLTSELRSFQVRAKPKILSLGIQTGYGIGLIDFKPTPYIGLGLGINLIGVK